MAPIPPDETERLRELSELDILDTMPEQEFDDLALLASQICSTPIATMTLIDSTRQWFKAKVGLADSEKSRDIAFCAHAICQPDLMIVPDAMQDSRFRDNPLVLGDPFIRFYAGAPLVTPRGHTMGTLCVIDRTPRTLTREQEGALQALGRQAVSLLELRRARAAAESATRAKGELLDRIQAEKSRSDLLLHSIFPEPVARQLKDSPTKHVAESFEDVTVLFADLHGFWRIAGSLPPDRLVDLLNRAFTLFDRLSQSMASTG
jgi:GAF domain-containing protein